jgi:bacterial/archaeal transporter family protein
MAAGAISTIGLLLATAASVGNVGFDVAAKRALAGNSFLHTSLKIRATVAVLLSIVLAVLWFRASSRSSVALFHFSIPALIHGGVLAILLLSTGLVTVSILLYYRSLQVAPISVTAPLFGLTPIFLLLTGFMIFRQIPSARVVAGVVCILAGSLLAHWGPGRGSIFGTVVHFMREDGVAPMLGACLLLSITNLLDKWLVMRLDVLSYAWLYVVLCALFTWALLLVMRPDQGSISGDVSGRWILLAGLIDGAVLLLHFGSLRYIDPVVTIAIKRSGMLLSVLAGAYFFHEQRSRQRLAAAFVVLMGVFSMYFTLRSWVLALVFAAALVGAIVAIAASRTARAEVIADAELIPMPL